MRIRDAIGAFLLYEREAEKKEKRVADREELSGNIRRLSRACVRRAHGCKV